MIKAKDYFDIRLNPKGKGIKNDYRVQAIDGDTVIYDAATMHYPVNQQQESQTCLNYMGGYPTPTGG